MKNEQTQKLYESLSGIDPTYLEEAREPLQRRQSRRSWKTWGALAACLCLIGVGLFAGLRGGGHLPPEVPSVLETAAPTEPQPTAALHTAEPIPPAQTETHLPFPAASSLPTFDLMPLPYNDAGEAPVAEYGMISLDPRDFVSMTTQEAMDYFGIDLPDVYTLAGLPLTGADCMGPGAGRYESETQGVYFDCNSFTYSDEDQRVVLAARTTFTHTIPTSEQVASGPEEMSFTEVNGWQLVLFRYPDEAGNPLVYTEFVLGDTVCSLSAAGLTDEAFAAALGEVLPEKESPADGITTCTGTVVSVDSREETYFDGQEHHVSTRRDWLTLDVDGTRYTVWLPGEAGAYWEGDQVTLSYRGEPATAYNIWPGQQISVEKVG